MILSGGPKKIVSLIMSKRAPSAESPANPEKVSEGDNALETALGAFIDAVHERDSQSAMSAFKEMMSACKYSEDESEEE